MAALGEAEKRRLPSQARHIEGPPQKAIALSLLARPMSLKMRVDTFRLWRERRGNWTEICSGRTIPQNGLWRHGSRPSWDSTSFIAALSGCDLSLGWPSVDAAEAHHAGGHGGLPGGRVAALAIWPKRSPAA